MNNRYGFFNFQVGSRACIRVMSATQQGNKPPLAVLAQCLNLQEPWRTRFVNSFQFSDEKGAASLGVYSLSAGQPYVLFERFHGGWIVNHASLINVALHEFLHEIYFEHLSSQERMRFTKEFLKSPNGQPFLTPLIKCRLAVRMR